MERTGSHPRRGSALLPRSALALAALVVGACASTSTSQGDGDGVPAPPPPVGARALARTLGLAEPRLAPDGAIYLEASRDERIALFPGTFLTTVRGERYRVAERLRVDGDDIWIPAADADVLRRMWQQGVRAGPSRTAVDAFRETAAGRSGDDPTRRLTLDDLPDAPRRPGTDEPAEAPALSRAVTDSERRAWGVPLRRDWKYVVLHHSATPSGSAAAFHKAHLARDWDGLAYHFVIGNGRGTADGAIEVGFRWTQQREGAHAGSDFWNDHGIGICLVGDFSKTKPTAAQMHALRRLCDFLSAHCGIPPQNLRRHGDVRDTECPGRHFPRTFVLGSASSSGGPPRLHRPTGRGGGGRADGARRPVDR